MSDPKPVWADLSPSDQDEELIEALISGRSVFSVTVEFEGVKYRELVRRMASPEFRAKAAPALAEAVDAARVSSAFLGAAMLLNGVAAKGGLAHNELATLLKLQKDIQGDSQDAPKNDDEKTRRAMDTIEKQRWKLQNLTPEA